MRGDNPVLEIVTMQRKHVRDIMPIENSVYPRPWTEKVFAEEIEMMGRGRRHYVVAHVGKVLVGYGGLLFAEEDAHITNIAVHPSYLRLGIASRMLVGTMSQAISRGVTAVTLEARASNAAAHRLYQRFGFAPGGIRHNYYADPREDALIMWAHDVNSESYAERLSAIEGGSANSAQKGGSE